MNSADSVSAPTRQERSVAAPDSAMRSVVPSALARLMVTGGAPPPRSDMAPAAVQAPSVVVKVATGAFMFVDTESVSPLAAFSVAPALNETSTPFDAALADQLVESLDAALGESVLEPCSVALLLSQAQQAGRALCLKHVSHDARRRGLPE